MRCGIHSCGLENMRRRAHEFGEARGRAWNPKNGIQYPMRYPNTIVDVQYPMRIPQGHGATRGGRRARAVCGGGSARLVGQQSFAATPGAQPARRPGMPATPAAVHPGATSLPSSECGGVSGHRRATARQTQAGPAAPGWPVGSDVSAAFTLDGVQSRLSPYFGRLDATQHEPARVW